MKSLKLITSSRGIIATVTIYGAHGRSAEISTLGAGIISLFTPDSKGRLIDVVLGYASPADYIDDGACMGKTPGRYAGRIGGARFSLGENEYELIANNGRNCLHGGPMGFAEKIWTIVHASLDEVTMAISSPDGDQGFPGNLEASIHYRWIGNVLAVNFKAHADKDTVLNLTNHSNFNLAGHNSGNCLRQELRIHAQNWLPTDKDMIPLGQEEPVAGTPMDFRKFKPLGQEINEDFPALKIGKGYDNTWVVEGKRGQLRPVADLRSPDTGIMLEVSSTQPGVQIYTGNWLDGCPEGKNGCRYRDYSGVAIECQAFPDSPNQKLFPSVVLAKGHSYQEKINFCFSTYKTK